MMYRTIYLALISYFLMLSVRADEEKISLSEMVTTLKGLGEACENEPTIENIREILLNQEEVGRETKCFRRCLMEILDLHVPESTQMREETALELGSIMYPDRKEDFALMLKTCNRRNAEIEDNCDAAHEHFLCMLKELRSNDFHIPQMEDD